LKENFKRFEEDLTKSLVENKKLQNQIKEYSKNYLELNERLKQIYNNELDKHPKRYISSLSSFFNSDNKELEQQNNSKIQEL